MKLCIQTILRVSSIVGCAALGAAGCSGCAKWSRTQPASATDVAFGNEPHTLTEVWTVRQCWVGLDRDPIGGEVYGLHMGSADKVAGVWNSEIRTVDRLGNLGEPIPIAVKNDSSSRLRVGRTAANALTFATFSVWRQGVYCFGEDGASKWSSTFPAGVNDVVFSSGQGPEAPEMFIGTTKEVLALGPRGEVLWKRLETKPACALAFITSQQPGGDRLVVQSIPSKIAVFGIDGDMLHEAPTAFIYQRLLSRLPVGGPAEVIGVKIPGLIAWHADGREVWSNTDDDSRMDNHITSDAALSPDQKWLAVTMRDGRLLVYNAETGERVAWRMIRSNAYPGVAWLGSADDEYRIAVASSTGVVGLAFALTSAPGRVISNPQ